MISFIKLPLIDDTIATWLTEHPTIIFISCAIQGNDIFIFYTESI
jgi:hypothetical protein